MTTSQKNNLAKDTNPSKKLSKKERAQIIKSLMLEHFPAPKTELK